MDRLKRELRRAVASGDKDDTKARLEALSVYLEHHQPDDAEKTALLHILTPFLVPVPNRDDSAVTTYALDVAISLTLHSSTFTRKLVDAGVFHSAVELAGRLRTQPPATTSACLVLCGNVLSDVPLLRLSVDWKSILLPISRRCNNDVTFAGRAEVHYNLVFLARALTDASLTSSPLSDCLFLVDLLLPKPMASAWWPPSTWHEATGALYYMLYRFGRPVADYILANGLLDVTILMFNANSCNPLLMYMFVVLHATDASALLRKAPPPAVICETLNIYRLRPHQCHFIVVRQLRRLCHVLRRVGVDPTPTLSGAFACLQDAPEAASRLYHLAGHVDPRYGTQFHMASRAASTALAAVVLRRTALAFVRVTAVTTHTTPTPRHRALFFQHN